VVPRGAWLYLLVVSLGASLCAPASGARAQESADLSAADAPQPAATVQSSEFDAIPSSDAVPPLEAPNGADAASEQILPTDDESPSPTDPESLETEPAAESEPTPSAFDSVELAAGQEMPAAPPLPGIGNDEVREMAVAQFSDSTIIAVIAANETRFDVSPRALVALKNAGVSERVIEAMLEAVAAKRDAPLEEVAEDEAAAAQAAQEYAKLTEMVERLAAQQQAAAAAQEAARKVAEPTPRADPTPRVWLLGPADRTPVAPTIAHVGFVGGGKRGSDRFRTLQGLAGQALAFASPAVSGIATTLGGLFRPDEERTAVWALTGPSSGRVLAADAAFEIDYAQIPGVDPDRYRPAVVQLVPTNDNYRLVAAAETEGPNTAALPTGEIIEELVDTELTRVARGRYRIAPRSRLHPGQYALVLRPVQESGRQRRRNKEASLGELLGGATTQILYLTWDFSVEPAN
jgi:hypothetical protein